MKIRDRFLILSLILFGSSIIAFVLKMQIWMIFLPISMITGVVGIMSENENYTEIEVELSEEIITALDDMAKDQGITRDELVNNILREEMKKYEKRVSKTQLENPEFFDEVMDDLEKNHTTYFICEDDELKNPVAVLMPIEYYQNMIDSASK